MSELKAKKISSDNIMILHYIIWRFCLSGISSIQVMGAQITKYFALALRLASLAGGTAMPPDTKT